MTTTPCQGTHKEIEMQTENATDTAASQIVDQMSEDDRAAFTRDAWRDGVSAMLVDEWAHLDLDEVLAAIEAMVEQ